MLRPLVYDDLQFTSFQAAWLLRQAQQPLPLVEVTTYRKLKSLITPKVAPCFIFSLR